MDINLYSSYLAFSAIFFCIGFGMLFLQKAVKTEIGPEYWAKGFFLNSGGFFFWALMTVSTSKVFFIVGDFLHMIGFILLVFGAYRFTGNKYHKKHIYSLACLASMWLLAILLSFYSIKIWLIILMLLRSVLFIWAGYMILTCISSEFKAGRILTGWSLIFWGLFVLFFPFVLKVSEIAPLALGFLVGIHILAGMGMVILVVDRIRLRAEDSENRIKRLEGLIPICANCKSIRDDKNSWQILETYIQEHSEAKFSHGLCPDCAKELYGDQSWFNKLKV